MTRLFAQLRTLVQEAYIRSQQPRCTSQQIVLTKLKLHVMLTFASLRFSG